MKQIKQVLFFGAVIALWQLVVISGIKPKELMPSFVSVASALWLGLTDGSIEKAILGSMQRMFVGFGLSVVIGIPLGFALGKSSLLEDTLGTLVLGLQTLPSVTWLPVAILWFGLNQSAIIFVVIMGSLLSITISTLNGLKHLQPIYAQAAQTMGAKGLNLVRHVVFPAILPDIIHGLKLGWSFAWRSLMAGELLFTIPGLGQQLNMGRDLNDMSQVFAIMIVIIAIGLIFDRLVFNQLDKRLRRRWGLQTAGE